MFKIFIDGQAGTTGLKIFEKLKKHRDVTLLILDEKYRKDIDKRVEMASQSDLSILCLPDQAAVEIVDKLKNVDTKIIDASTAHRTNIDWTYGFPELKGYREKIANAKKVTNPGCYATGFIALIKPLIDSSTLPPSYPFYIHGVSGYSGGGKSLISSYEKTETNKKYYYAPYQLDLKHKHLTEMKMISGIDTPPLFMPAVDPFYQGMFVHIPLHKETLNSYTKKSLDKDDILGIYHQYFAREPFVRIRDWEEMKLRENKFFDIKIDADHNYLDISVFGKSNHLVLAAKFDNLGKGASGAAIQNMNIMIGLDETRCLI
ncbi:MAG: N-acetyl-gamma-glutamyl-phosphate reductase [Gammaproteobacteria bacterium]|nr:N-acetyl-gamma-glutamyl-phosphate reductase [Gammaproteobacteria bacterium]